MCSIHPDEVFRVARDRHLDFLDESAHIGMVRPTRRTKRVGHGWVAAIGRHLPSLAPRPAKVSRDVAWPQLNS
jgi:hypothetical protein